VTRGWLPQRAGLPDLNGGGAVSFKNFENSLTTAKVMTKTKVAPFYLGHGVEQVYDCT